MPAGVVPHGAAPVGVSGPARIAIGLVDQRRLGGRTRLGYQRGNQSPAYARRPCPSGQVTPGRRRAPAEAVPASGPSGRRGGALRDTGGVRAASASDGVRAARRKEAGGEKIWRVRWGYRWSPPGHGHSTSDPSGDTEPSGVADMTLIGACAHSPSSGDLRWGPHIRQRWIITLGNGPTTDSCRRSRRAKPDRDGGGRRPALQSS
jgi:hypothetical protein